MIFPRSQDQGVVVFLIWKDLPFRNRVSIGTALLLAGLALQAAIGHFLPGLPFLAAGTLLLLVRGCNNRVDFGQFDPAANWENVALEKLDELVEHDRRMARWDRSALDVTNSLGAFVLLLFAVPMVFVAFNAQSLTRILFLDALILLVPHWLTGTRGIMRQPNLVLKADILRELIDNSGALLSRHSLQLLMLLKGDQRLPTDLKLKVALQDQSPEFLGLYGQIVLNRVQGKPYPYFYVVLVAKPGCGLSKLGEHYHPPEKLIREFKEQTDVEVLVIRQLTTKTSGYHTTPRTMERLLAEGIRLAESWNTTATPDRG